MNLNFYNKLVDVFASSTSVDNTGCRDGEDFAKIKNILEAINDPNRDGSTINWKVISDISFNILSKNEKDMLVACYMSVAMLHSYGLEGLFNGLKTINLMIKDSWEDIYPPLKRINGRWAAIEWLNIQLQIFIDNNKSEYIHEEIDFIKSELTDIDKNLVSLHDDPPNLFSLIKLFNNLKIKEVVSAIDNDDLNNDDLNNETKIKTQHKAINSIDDALLRANELYNELQNICNYIMSNNSDIDVLKTNYKLSRFLIWKDINKLPNYDENNKTKVPAPNKDQIDRLQHLLKIQNYKTIISESEKWMVDNPYWIDIHFSLYNAIKSENDDISIANVIKNECRSFVLKFPKLKELSFDNGNKMVSNDTYQWLISDIDFGGDTGVNIKNTNNDIFLTELINVSSQAEDNKIKYLTDIYDRYSNVISNYKKIDFYIVLIKQLTISNKYDLLKIYIKILEKDFSFYNLASLDKELAVKALQTLITAKKAIDQDYHENYSILCEIDMKVALSY